MIHQRHFTVDEANELLAGLTATLEALRAARDRLTDAEAHEALSQASGGNGGGAHGRHVGEAFLEVRRGIAELNALGVVVRDLERGLVDFPAIMEGREVYLCWQLGEPAVAHWHHLDAGFAGRMPLD